MKIIAFSKFEKLEFFTKNDFMKKVVELRCAVLSDIYSISDKHYLDEKNIHVAWLYFEKNAYF